MRFDTHEHTHAHDMSVGLCFDTHEHTHAHDMASVGAMFLDTTRTNDMASVLMFTT
jgi:hypothetical protein